jgi:hypothetical protein
MECFRMCHKVVTLGMFLEPSRKTLSSLSGVPSMT